MMYFKIEYIQEGKLKTTIIKASSIVEAISIFRNKRIGILKNIEEVKKTSFLEELDKRFSIYKIDLQEFVSVLEQIYVMLDAGISIDLVLNNIGENIKNKKLKEIFKSVFNDVKAGLSLYEAFKKYEKDLGKLTLSMIKLGEETGDLANAIKDLSTILQEILDNRKRLKKATRYPLFIIFAMSIAFIIVILFVIPPFKTIFVQLNTELPLPTRFLLWIEAAIQNYGIYILTFAFIIFGIILYLYNKSENIRLKLDKLILKVYIVGQVIKLAMIGRFIYVFERLLSSGIPILDAVDMALNIVDNEYIKKRLLLIKNSIQTGGSITQGFKDSKLFENMIIQMVSAGEESGALVLMLQKVSKYYLDKYRYIVDNIAILIEPILIAAIAGFVMTLALGIFLPMWNLTESIQ
ncbi:type II secretion system F family protein [Caminibacter profundus]